MERKDKLFEVALDEFIESGYDKASLNNILKKAGISKGSFYYHFSNKKELYLYLFRSLHDLEHQYIDEWKQESNIDYGKLNFFQILKIEGKIALEIIIKYPKYYQFWRSMYEKKNPEVIEIIEKEMKELINNGHAKDYLMPLIEQGLKKKDFREELPEEFIKRILCDSMINFFNCFVKEDKDFEMENLKKNYEDYIDFLDRGLGKKK